MEEKSSQSKTILWVVLGCLGLLLLFCTAAVIAVSGWLLISNREQADSSKIVFEETSNQLVSPSITPSLSTETDTEEIEAAELQPTEINEASVQPDAESDRPQIVDPAASQRNEIEEKVASIRGLEPVDSIVPTFLTSDELRIRLEEDLFEEYGPEEARNDAITLSAFDFIPADFDLYSFFLDLYAEQIAGFYDPESDEFVVISSDSNFGGVEQLTHAHEFVHALQDQHFNLEGLDDESLNSEELFALQSFVEGEATLVQMQFLESGFFELDELASLLMDILGSTVSADMEILESAPPILASELEFPYIAGMEFVQSIYAQGGFEAVNNVWNNLPTSSEQIIHPDRYLSNDQPIEVTLSPIGDSLGQEWTLIDEDMFGEFYLRQYLNQHLEPSQVDIASTGWGGDSYAVYHNDDTADVAMILKLVWDSPADKAEFETAYTSFAANRFGSSAVEQAAGGTCWTGSDVICLKSVGNFTQIVRAPDLTAASSISNSQD